MTGATRTFWRICKNKHLKTAFDGDGARRYPGRWNSRGIPMVYCASSPSLALLEILVHLQDVDPLFDHYSLLSAQCHANEVMELDEVPSDWDAEPAPLSTRKVGDDWIKRQETVVLSVPSVIVPMERVYLINPVHPHFSGLVIADPQPFGIDLNSVKRLYLSCGDMNVDD